VPIKQNEYSVQYGFECEEDNQFFVPGFNDSYNIAFTSCNGICEDSEVERLNGVLPLWKDLMRMHGKVRYHGMIGGGDQIYCDKVFQLNSLQQWLKTSSNAAKTVAEFSQAMKDEITDYYFNNYLTHFQTPGFKEALANIPFNFIWDDHDIFDGYGSYPTYLQTSPVFFGIFDIAHRFYLLFQHHNNVKLVKADDIGRGHTSLLQYGPKLAVLSLDVRSERSLTRIIPAYTWELIWDRLDKLPSSIKHLIVSATIPLAYPRVGGEGFFTFAKTAAKGTRNLLNTLQNLVMSEKPQEANELDKETWGEAFTKTGAFKEIVNSFGEPELLDDLNDHWTSENHKEERKEVVTRMQNLAKKNNLRVTFLSGDVHVGGVGKFASEKGLLYPDQDYRLMYQIVSSAIGNSPPPQAIIHHLHLMSKKIFFNKETVEKMHHIFPTDLDGQPQDHQYVMAARNWCSITSPNCYDLVFDLRMEKVQGDPRGETKSYYVHVPPLNCFEE
jgi:hypothetical protein